MVRKKFMAGSLGRKLQAANSGANVQVRAAAFLVSNDRSRSVAFGALHAALDPVERLHAGRRVDAFGRKILDVDQVDSLGVRVVLGAAERDRLDRLVTVGKLHL